MRFFSTILAALRALRRNKMRSVLTALGIIIGVAAVIAMVSIINGAKSQLQAQIASLGQNVVLVFSGNFSAGGVRSGLGGAGTLTVDDALAIQNEVRGVLAVSPEVRDHKQVLANGLNWATQILGEGPDYLTIRDWVMTAGNMFTEQDLRSTAKVCIVGQTIVNQLFPNQDPVGQTLRIQNIPFKVVGVLSVKGLSVMGTDQDDVVIVPYTSEMKRVSKRTNLGGVNVQAESSEAETRVESDITDLLRQRHHITDPSGHSDDFTIHGQDEIQNAISAQASTMTYLLGGVAGVSLLVGGIGIMNIMLVSVTERTREIGIRMAVGAHGRDILAQFLIEAVVLSLIGGGLGVLLGIGGAQLFSRVNHWTTLVSTSSVIIALLFSGAVGVFFGFYPARKAAQLDPIDALRYE
ncbi:MAG: ABC transporter permease [Opitutaceae bacterium]|jgi:putative ABC transport system permease protein